MWQACMLVLICAQTRGEGIWPGFDSGTRVVYKKHAQGECSPGVWPRARLPGTLREGLKHV